MRPLARSDQSVFGRWWWTIDRWTLLAIALLILIGILSIQAATPAIAAKRGLDNYYYVERHLFMLIIALGMMFWISLSTPRHIRWLAVGLLGVFLPMMAATLVFGIEIKGATRWIHFMGLSIQPSEFMKPALTIIAAWLFTRQCEKKTFPGLGLNIFIFGLITLCLLGQPDIGMTVLTAAIWFGQFFLAGLPLPLVGISIMVGSVGLFAAYHLFPHFTSRMDRFLNHTGDTYQIDRSLDAFVNGGLWGTGPGQGTVKMSIPDAHADFVFAVAGEEMGLLFCLLIVFLFAFIVLRGLWRLHNENNLFIVLAVGGLLIEFGLQAIINLASTLHLIPAKGMTLPFISYGGSSLWALAISMGMLLALTRKRFGLQDV